MLKISARYEWTDRDAAITYGEMFRVDYAPDLTLNGEDDYERQLCLKFNAKSLKLEIFNRADDPDFAEPQNSEILKLTDIAEDAKAYMDTIEAMSEASSLEEMHKLDAIRSDLHKNMARRVEDKLTEIGVSFGHSDKEDGIMTDFARNVITCWFNTIGYCEDQDTLNLTRQQDHLKNFTELKNVQTQPSQGFKQPYQHQSVRRLCSRRFRLLRLNFRCLFLDHFGDVIDDGLITAVETMRLFPTYIDLVVVRSATCQADIGH